MLWCCLGVELLEQEWYFTGFSVAKQSCAREALSSLNLQIPKNDFADEFILDEFSTYYQSCLDLFFLDNILLYADLEV